MKALSILQPWATLVALGAKHYETRSWNTPFRGLLAIHASKSFSPWARDLCLEPPFREALRGRDLPLGAIVGYAHLVATYSTNRMPELTDTERAFGNYQPDRFAWEFRNVQWLPVPIPCKGNLGLWEVPPEIERQFMTTIPDPIRKLAHLRKSKGWSRAETARRFPGITARSIAAWEHGTRRPKLLTLEAIKRFIAANQ